MREGVIPEALATLMSLRLLLVLSINFESEFVFSHYLTSSILSVHFRSTVPILNI